MTETIEQPPVSPSIPAPIVKRQGNMVPLILSTVIGTWADVETAGTAADRPMDLVFPNCKVDQWIEVSAGIWTSAANGVVYLDMWTIVSGVPVNKFGLHYGETDDRASSWLLPANLQMVDVGNARPYQIKAADIQDGSVRVRLRSNCANATAARQILRNFQSEFLLVGRGPFG